MKHITALCAPYLSLWHGLLALACLILIYLTGVHISEALNASSCYTVFSAEEAFLSWEPSRGEIDHYLLEITDTHLIGSQFPTQGGSMSTTRYATSALTSYRLAGAHNHSYQVRVKAISPCGASSEYSEPSILFICDQEPPTLMLDPLPYPHQKVRSQSITLTGSFDEAYLQLIADLSRENADAVKLVVPKNDITKSIYVSGGFARNETFVRMLATIFPDKKVFTSEVDNATALGAALMVWDAMEIEAKPAINLGLKAYKGF